MIKINDFIWQFIPDHAILHINESTDAYNFR